MIEKLKFGEKVKERRMKLGMTQKDVAGDFMTRNMLSIIESGRAMPSIETAVYLSKVLDISLSYLFSYDKNYFFFEKQEKLPHIRELYENKQYNECMELIDSLSDSDDELHYIYAFCALKYGRKMLFSGSLSISEKYLKLALDTASKTFYSTFEIEATAHLYLSVASNIQAPLLEFDSERYEMIKNRTFDYEFFKYITMDYEYTFENENYKKHLEAKRLLKKYKYIDAIALLQQLEELKNKEYNAYMLFGVYSDIEIAYRQIGDFENAYRYASKKLSLINGFK